MPKVKYTGSADQRVVPKGANFGGRLAEPIGSKIEFNHDNHFLIDTEEEGLSAEAVQLLLESDDFRDVTDLKTYPRSGAETRLYGRGRVDAESVGEEDEAQAASGPRKRTASGGGSSTAAAGTTTGGSTAGGGTGS